MIPERRPAFRRNVRLPPRQPLVGQRPTAVRTPFDHLTFEGPPSTDTMTHVRIAFSSARSLELNQHECRNHYLRTKGRRDLACPPGHEIPIDQPVKFQKRVVLAEPVHERECREDAQQLPNGSQTAAAQAATSRRKRSGIARPNVGQVESRNDFE